MTKVNSSKIILLIVLCLLFTNFSISASTTNKSLTPTHFVSGYTEFLWDEDGNGLWDYLNISVQVNVTEDGKYRVYGYLCDKNDTMIAVAQNISNMSIGLHDVILKFDGAHIYLSEYNGSFQLLGLSLENETCQIDYRSWAYNTSTYNYTDFQRPDIYFTETFIDYGRDANGNGLFDHLIVDLYVNVSVPSTYTISGSLYEHNGSFIERSSNTTYLTQSDSMVQLEFNGEKISSTIYSGCFFLTNLQIIDESSQLVSWKSVPYITASYSYTDFEIPPTSFTYIFTDYGTDINGNTLYDNLIIDVGVNIHDAGVYTLFGYLHDQNGQFVACASNTSLLGTRIHLVELNFDGGHLWQTGRDTFYTLDVTLYNSTNASVCSIEHAYTTKFYNYTAFEHPSIILTGEYDYYSIDVDDDGLLDYLCVGIELNATISGNYLVKGYLYDYSGINFIGFSKNNSYLDEGLQTVVLEFNAAPIHEQQTSNILNLTFIEIYRENNPVSWAATSYLISGYNWTQFSPMVAPDLTLNENDIVFSVDSPTEGDKITITVTIHNVGNGYVESSIIKIYDGVPNTENIIDTIELSSVKYKMNISIQINWTAITGEHTIYVVIESTDPLESNTTNNMASRIIVVKEKPVVLPNILLYVIIIIILAVLAGAGIGIMRRKKKLIPPEKPST